MTDQSTSGIAKSGPEMKSPVGKVLVLSGSFPPMPCGVGDSAWELAKVLKARGVDIEVLADKSATEIPGGEIPFPVHADISNWGLGNTSKLVSKINEINPDILHIHYPTIAYGRGFAVPMLPTRLRAMRAEIEIVLTLHEFRLSHHLRKLASFILLDPCDAVIMPCPLELNALIRRHKSVEEKIHAAIPGGAVGPSPDDFSGEEKIALRKSTRAEWGVDDDEVVLLHYGTPTKSKGLEDLFKALRFLKKEGETPKLVIAGDFRPDEVEFHKTLKGQPGGLGVGDQVIWLGRKNAEDLPGIFLGADIGVFPFVDGFSFRRTSLIGLLMWDVPIITTIPDGELDEVYGQEKVRFVDAGSPKGIATAVMTLTANPKALESAKETPNPLKDYFLWETIASRYIKIFSLIREDGSKHR